MSKSKKTGSQRPGTKSGRKTTARKETSKGPAAKARSHAKRSAAGGRSMAAEGPSRTLGLTSRSDRPRRGPGAVGLEGGRLQSSAGTDHGSTPKRAK